METTVENTKIIIPINFTHSADIDGIVCGILTNSICLGGVNCGDAYFAKPFIIGMPANTEQMESIIQEKITHKNITDYTEYACSSHYTSDTIEGENLEYLIIVTDLHVPTVFIDYVKKVITDCYPDSHIGFWEFDHHASNPEFGKFTYNFNEDEFYLPERVCICDNYFKTHGKCKVPELDITFNKLCGAKDIKREIEELIVQYKLDGGLSVAERSAAYVYFRFLLDMGLFDFHDLNFMINLIKLVYHTSMYDTFEFSKKDRDCVIDHDYMDALTVLWKSYKGDFFRFLNMVYDSLDDIPLVGEYEYLPTLPKSELLKLSFLFDQRKTEYRGVTKGIRVFPYERIKYALNLECNEELKYEDNVAVILQDVTDASFVGNTLLKDYPKIKLVIMLFTNSRTASFRSSNLIDDAPDCGKIATLDLNGGGHKHAAGAVLSQDKFINILTLFWNTDKANMDDYK